MITNDINIRYRLAVLTLVVIGISLVLFHFHDRYWWAPDDGHYAHIAERISNGEVLHGDIDDFHTDYAYLVNTLAIKVFGPDLLSMRLPLAALTVLQSCLVFVLFWRAPIWTAVAAATAFGTLTFIQYLNPQPHWYALFLVVVVLVVLCKMPPTSISRIAILGFLVGSIFLFRQLTGVFVAIAVTTFLLVECPRGPDKPSPVLARIVLGIMFVGVLGFLLIDTNSLGFMLFGIWPLGILVGAMVRTSVSNSTTMTILLYLCLGGVAAFIPLAIYHAAHGTFEPWITTIFWRAMNVQNLPYLDNASYIWLIGLGLRNIYNPITPVQVLNGIYWVVLPTIAMLNGVLTLQYLRRIDPMKYVSGAIPIMAAFYSLVSIFNQIFIYMYYTTALSFAGFLWLIARKSKTTSFIFAISVLTICSVGVLFQAGQPLSRTLAGVIRGERVELTLNDRFERARLWIEASDIEIYGNLIDLIHANTEPNDPIFVFPNHPELYFLSDRTNPFDFLNTSLNILNEQDASHLIQGIQENNIPLIIYESSDKHRNQFSDKVMSFVLENYEKLTSVNTFDVYRRKLKP